MILSTLYAYAERFKDAKASIIATWVSFQEIQEIFQLHGIDSEQFKSLFASHVFDYYMDIMSGEDNIGHCPNIDRYFNFLNYQNISPDQLFVICTHFRKSLIAYTYEAGIATESLHNEVNLIIDKNIQGVLKRFHSIYTQNDTDHEAQRRGLLEAQKIAKVGHWEFDLKENHLYWSDEVYRIFGLDPEEFNATYQAFLAHIHPEDLEMVNAKYADSINSKRPYHVIHRILTKTKEVKYVEERCYHETDTQGNIIRSIGTVHDVSEKMASQQELSLASQLFKHTNDAVVITDKDNNIVMVNESFTRLTGYTINEVKGSNPRHFSSGWGNDTFYTEMWSDIINKGAWQGEVIDQKKSGEYYAASLTILNIQDDQGKTTNYIGISKDITEAKAQEKMITQLAYYDTLTNLPNRSYLREEMRNIIKRSKRDNLTFAILYFDIDDFKWLNDSLGHKYGNQALVEVTRRIQEVLDGDMIFCRMGGDEFAIYAPYTDIESINQLAKRILEALQTPLIIKNKSIRLGTSIGISHFPENGQDYGSLLQSADIALYHVKENGKNHFIHHNSGLSEKVTQRLDIAIHLRQAIENDAFMLVYQPKIDTQTNKVYGYEALIRWVDPKLGFISPAQFIPIAEEGQLIHDIGNWVLSNSLKQSRTLLKENPDLTISINISGEQLKATDFVPSVHSIVEASDVRPQQIEFEITETAIMENIDDIVFKLNQIKELGISISIDDFGTGYSSMAYLKKLPIETIKIDRAFVNEIDRNEDDKAIIEAIVAMCRRLHLKTIAEGVETQPHVDILGDIGINHLQGYFFSQPIAIEQLTHYVSEFNGIGRPTLVHTA